MALAQFQVAPRRLIASGAASTSYLRSATPQSTYAASGAATANAATGDVIVGAIHWRSGTITLSSVASACISSMTVNSTSTNNGARTASFSGKVTSGASPCTVTGTLSAAANLTIAFDVVGGSTNGTPADGNSITGTAAASAASGDITTTANGAFLYSFCFDTGFNMSAGTDPSGFTAGVTDIANYFMTSYKIQSTAGTVGATYTGLSPTWTTYAVGIAAIKP